MHIPVFSLYVKGDSNSYIFREDAVLVCEYVTRLNTEWGLQEQARFYSFIMPSLKSGRRIFCPRYTPQGAAVARAKLIQS